MLENNHNLFTVYFPVSKSFSVCGFCQYMYCFKTFQKAEISKQDARRSVFWCDDDVINRMLYGAAR